MTRHASRRRTLRRRIAALTFVVVTTLAAAGSFTRLQHADAATVPALPSPDAVFHAWNDAFLVQANGQTYYTNELKSKGTERAGEWIAALDIAVAQDAYERTHAAADRQRVDGLVTTLLANEGTTWASWDTWNDNVAWMVTAVLRGYQLTGNTAWLTVAADQWNAAYNRGWTSDGGGGIWEDMGSKYSKCALSNDPMISTAVGIYLATGDGAYLTKAEAIYDWVRSHIVDTTTGVVNECIAFPNGPGGATVLQPSDNAYNAGSFIEAADHLYRVTGNTAYRDDAQRTADHFLNTVPVVANNAERGSSYQYWLFKGMSDFCTDTGTCSRYDAYMRSNAAQAWSERNSANLTWNDWTQPTTDTNPDAFEMAGMVGLFQALPNNNPSPFTGDYQIRSEASGQSLGVQNNSTANAAAVVQGLDTADPSQSWTFVPQSNGYYTVKNARSGQLLNVNAESGRPGGLIVQWPAGGLVPGNDLWQPARNSDGTWSLYNRNSHFALDDPGGSNTAGTQYEQWPANDTANQRFTLISRATGAAPAGGALLSGIPGKCLDVNAADSTNGTPVQLWDCNPFASQQWTPAADGTFRALGKCLDAVGLGTANGTKLDIWDCNGGPNQQWQPYNGGYRNPASGRCIDDPGASSTNGTQQELWDCNGFLNQQWSNPST